MSHIHNAHRISRHIAKQEQPKFFELLNGSGQLQSAMFPEGRLSIDANGALRVSANGLTSAEEKILHHIAHVSCTLKLGNAPSLASILFDQARVVDPVIDWEKLDREELKRIVTATNDAADESDDVVDPLADPDAPLIDPDSQVPVGGDSSQQNPNPEHELPTEPEVKDPLPQVVAEAVASLVTPDEGGKPEAPAVEDKPVVEAPADDLTAPDSPIQEGADKPVVEGEAPVEAPVVEGEAVVETPVTEEAAKEEGAADTTSATGKKRK
jgi:hypothetical protein